MLKTFVRRIPITISIPDFDERPLDDQIELIHYLISKEAQRVNKTIKISAEAIKALIGSTSFGNVGQLKSNIQLACAKGFLNCINADESIDINLNLIPPNIKNGILIFGNKVDEDATAWNIIPNTITIQPDGNKTFLETDAYEPPFNIYSIIEDKTFALQEEGMSEDEIKNFITTDINLHLKQFYAKFKNDIHRREGLLKIVDSDIVDFAEEIKTLAENRLNKKLNERFIYATSLHFGALFNRIKKKTVSFSSPLELSSTINSEEYAVAKEIHSLIEKRYNLTIPPVEKELVQDIIDNITTDDINIIPIGLDNLNKSISHISNSNKIIALIGIKNPNMGIPFISLENLIDGSGEKVLKNLIDGKVIIAPNNKAENQIVLKTLCKQGLREMLTFLNPEKICSLLEDFVINIEKSLCINYGNSNKLRIMLHVACALERMIIDDSLVYKESPDTLNKNNLSALKKASLIFKNSLSISLTNDELYYMVDMLNEY